MMISLPWRYHSPNDGNGDIKILTNQEIISIHRWISLFSSERVPDNPFRAGISTPGTQNTIMVFHLIIPDHLRDCKTHRTFFLAGSAASTSIILHR